MSDAHETKNARDVKIGPQLQHMVAMAIRNMWDAHLSMVTKQSTCPTS